MDVVRLLSQVESWAVGFGEVSLFPECLAFKSPASAVQKRRGRLRKERRLQERRRLEHWVAGKGFLWQGAAWAAEKTRGDRERRATENCCLLKENKGFSLQRRRVPLHLKSFVWFSCLPFVFPCERAHFGSIYFCLIKGCFCAPVSLRCTHVKQWGPEGLFWVILAKDCSWLASQRWEMLQFVISL